MGSFHSSSVHLLLTATENAINVSNTVVLSKSCQYVQAFQLSSKVVLEICNVVKYTLPLWCRAITESPPPNIHNYIQQSVQDSNDPPGGAEQTSKDRLPGGGFLWCGTDVHLDTVQGGPTTATVDATFMPHSIESFFT